MAVQMYKRPLLIYGAGVQSCRAEAIAFAERTGIPVALTWGAADLMPWKHPLRVGTFGTHGVKAANLAVQNADFVLSVGSRLDTKATGYPVSSFAPMADLCMVDVDRTEIEKFAKLGRDLRMGSVRSGESVFSDEVMVSDLRGSYALWLATIGAWKHQHPTVLPEWRDQSPINPYVFVDALADYLLPDDIIVSDTGCALAWMMQAYRFDGKQRFIHAFNQTPMGCGLGLAVGAAFATGKRVICITGDGGLSLGRAEMTTIAGHNLPVKIILFANGAHSMCMGTQRQWLGGEYPATSKEGGLHFPDFVHLARAEGIAARKFFYPPEKCMDCLDGNYPYLLQINVDRLIDVYGQIKFGEPLA